MDRPTFLSRLRHLPGGRDHGSAYATGRENCTDRGFARQSRDLTIRHARQSSIKPLNRTQHRRRESIPVGQQSGRCAVNSATWTLLRPRSAISQNAPPVRHGAAQTRRLVRSGPKRRETCPIALQSCAALRPCCDALSCAESLAPNRSPLRRRARQSQSDERDCDGEAAPMARGASLGAALPSLGLRPIAGGSLSRYG